MSTFNIFPYHWNWDDNGWDDNKRKATTIRIWGWNERNEGVCVRVTDFRIPIYAELPDVDTEGNAITWTDRTIELAIKFLESAAKNWISPVGVYPEVKKPLYDNRFYVENGKLETKSKTYLKLEFKSQVAIDKFVKDFLSIPVSVPQIGTIRIRHYCSKKSLSPVMKLMTVRSLPSSNWIQGRGTCPARKESNKRHEYIVSFENLFAHPDSAKLPLVHPLVCSFDIEAYSSDGSRMPDPEFNEDVILQIGCVFARKGKIEKKICLSIGKPEKPPVNTGENDDFILQIFDSERQMLLGWTQLMCKMDPDVLIGYNIFGFDLMYMQKRAEICQISADFAKFGCIASTPAEARTMEWESSARGKIKFTYYDVQGRIFIDVLPMVQASEKLPSYKLEYVAGIHLKTNKDPIKPKDIFKSWKTKDWHLFYRVAAYCTQDCVVTYLLYEKLMFWLGLVESATVNKVPIFCMVVQGQQIKAYAQVFDYCYHHELVCNAPDKMVKSPYRGAFVEEPLSGLYNMILPFDFASLYPSIMIAHNIDFSTFVHHSQLDEIPKEMYEVFSGDDHVGCIHDPKYKETKQRYRKDGTPIIAKPKKIVCTTYNHVFIKNDYKRGAIPIIITELLAARKKVRKVIEEYENTIHELETENETLDPTSEKYKANKEEMNRLKEINQVLDKRQSAYKVNANSMYGMYGAENGYLPFFAGAETVTFVGRRSIKAASDRLEQKHGGRVIYNDTDSAYTYFPHLVNASVKEIWDFASGVVDDIKTLFRAPMKLEFEGKIYPNFLILTKKRYVAQTVDEHGKLKDKLTIRGLPMVRREYCKNMTVLYEAVVRTIFKNIKAITSINKHTDGVLLRRQPEYLAILDMINDNFVKTLSWQCMSKDVTNKYLDFTIFKGLNKEKYAGTVAHAVVADKIRARGTPVSQNSRIEMVYICQSNLSFDKNKKVAEIAEDLGYFKEFAEILRIDYLQYFKSQYINNFDVLLEVVFGAEHACTNMFKHHVQKNLFCKQLKHVFKTPVSVDKSKFDEKAYNLYKLMEKHTDNSVRYVSNAVEVKEEKEEKKETVKEVYRELCDELMSGVKSSWNLRITNEVLSIVNSEYQNHTCYPVKQNIFRCFKYFELQDTKVVLLGQDPYPGTKKVYDENKQYHLEPQAMGLSFSVPSYFNPPPSLQNMFKEMKRDLGVERVDNEACLEDWAKQGVLLLNSALTLRASESNSHKKQWISFTNGIISMISRECRDVVFILLGNDARSKATLIDKEKHFVLEAGHPSTLNQKGTFEGCCMYSKTNAYLVSKGKQEIFWVGE